MRKLHTGATLVMSLLVGAAFGLPLLAQDQGSMGVAEDSPPRRGPTDPGELEAFIDGLMGGFVQDHDLAGATVSVVRDGALLFAKGYGYADVGAGTRVDAERTLFRIGSASKLFTWTAVMQLVEQGKLELDTDVNDYLDFEIPATYPRPITMTHLLTHTPGFEDRGMELWGEYEGSRGEWLRLNVPARVRPPGTFTAYSNYGSGLAGYIVERVSGVSWEEYIERYITGPLGMARTTARQPLPEPLADDRSAGYVYADGRFLEQEFQIARALAPAGSMSSSATDMARFMLAHLGYGELDGNRILEEETVRRMHGRLFGNDDRVTGFAHGFYEMSSHGLRIIGHGGDTSWFHSRLALIPEEDLGVFVSNNTAAGEMVTFSLFLRAFLDHYYPVRDGPSVALANVDLDPYVGAYRMNRMSYTTFEKAIGLLAPAMTMTVTAGDGELILNSPLGVSRLVPTGDGAFRDTESRAHLVFRDEAGVVTHMFHDIGPQMAMERLSWYEHPEVHRRLLTLTLLVFLSVPVAMLGRFLLQRRFGTLGIVMGGAKTARRVGGVMAFVHLAAVLGLFRMATRLGSVLGGNTGAFKAVLALPVLGALLTLAVLFFAWRGWKGRYWSLWGRLHYSALAVAGVVFAWSMNYWNLLGWHF